MESKKDLSFLLPKRSKKSNKTDGGKVLIIGGAKGLYGAGILAALAATRTGAGYTHLMTDLSKFSFLKYPDFIVHPIKISELKNKEKFAVGIGPGLGINKLNYLKYLMKKNFELVVADADALTIIAKNNLFPLPATWILTPHEGELARLLNVNSILIKKNREKYLKVAALKYQCTILLKGSTTLIADQKVYRISIGTAALAKAGTGDVLLGIIAALRAQKLSAINACLLGTYLHGYASQMWMNEKNDELSLRPTDLIDLLPSAIYQVRNQKS